MLGEPTSCGKGIRTGDLCVGAGCVLVVPLVEVRFNAVRRNVEVAKQLNAHGADTPTFGSSMSMVG